MEGNSGLEWWRRFVDCDVGASSPWHSSQRGLVRTSDMLGDHLAMAMREAAWAGKGGKPLAICAYLLIEELREYTRESRLLFKLANTGRVVQAMQRTIETVLSLLNLRGSPEAETWRQELRQERDQRLQIYHDLLAGEDRLCAELGNEQQQLEVQTLFKFGFKKYRDELSVGEWDTMVAMFDASVRLSNMVVRAVPAWFATNEREWTGAKWTCISGGEEACLRNVTAWASLQHPNVRKFYGACHVGETAIAIHEETATVWYCKGFDWRRLRGCARGILFVHERGFVHESLTNCHLLKQDSKEDGLLSGLGLVRSSTTDDSLQVDPSEQIGSMAGSQRPSRSNDVMQLGILIFQVIVEKRVSFSGRKLLETSETKPLPDTKPDFVNTDEWRLLQGMCAANPADRISMLDVVHQMSTLVDQQKTSSDREESDSYLETVKDVRQYQVASLGETLGDALDDAASWCDDAGPDLAAVQRPVCDRLMDIYKQLLSSPTPLPLRLIDEFSDIVRRFSVKLDGHVGDNYDYSYNFSQSLMGTLCASRTLARRNYGLHYDIDYLLLKYSEEGLDSSAEVHQWQPSIKKLCQRQRQTLETLMEDPSSMLEGMESEAERSEALTLLQSEAQSTGLSTAGTINALPEWFVPPHRVQLGKHIADGSFGSVYEGMYLDSPVVVKQLLTSGLGEEERRQFLQEANLWYSLSHLNVIQLYGACHEGRPFFVCERAMGGTIVEYAKKEPRDVWVLLACVAQGLQHLHDHGIIHGDLKGNNILVDVDGNPKLADFGLSFVANATDSTTAADNGALGAFRWKAPEVLTGCKATFASDIYSFGMCIIETVTGIYPWGNSILDVAVKHNVVEGRLLPQRPTGFSDEQWSLVERMCCYDPEERITAGAVVGIIGEFVQ